MSLFGKILPVLTSSLQRLTPMVVPRAGYHIINVSSVQSSILSPWSLTQVRWKPRCYFPRPSETKRIKRHGFWARMKTAGGRAILMRRILKSRHVLSH